MTPVLPPTPLSLGFRASPRPPTHLGEPSRPLAEGAVVQDEPRAHLYLHLQVWRRDRRPYARPAARHGRSLLRGTAPRLERIGQELKLHHQPRGRRAPPQARTTELAARLAVPWRTRSQTWKAPRKTRSTPRHLQAGALVGRTAVPLMGMASPGESSGPRQRKQGMSYDKLAAAEAA